MSVAKRQTATARFLVEPDFEARVRAEPVNVAAELGLDPAFVVRLCEISAARVQAFRRGRHTKARRREG